SRLRASPGSLGRRVPRLPRRFLPPPAPGRGLPLRAERGGPRRRHRRVGGNGRPPGDLRVHARAHTPPPVEPISPRSLPLSSSEVDYPLVREIHAAASLVEPDEVKAVRASARGVARSSPSW